MKKILILSVAVLLLSASIASACGTEPIIIVAAGSGGWGGFCWPIIIMEAAVLAAFSPWLIMYNQHPECRDKPTMGDMAACVQKGGK